MTICMTINTKFNFRIPKNLTVVFLILTLLAFSIFSCMIAVSADDLSLADSSPSPSPSPSVSLSPSPSPSMNSTSNPTPTPSSSPKSGLTFDIMLFVVLIAVVVAAVVSFYYFKNELNKTGEI